MSIDPQVTRALQQAVQLHKAGNLAAAEKSYRDVLLQHPGHADAIQLLGVLSYQLGRHDEAVDLISSAIAIAPTIADWHNNLGNALKAQGKLEHAVRSYERALQLNAPNAATVRLNMGNVLMALARNDEAAAEYQKAVNAKPDFFEARLNLGSLLLARFEFDAAIEHLAAATRLRPGSFDAHVALARAYEKKEFFASAAEHYRHALEIKPDHASARGQLASALSFVDPDAAVAEYRGLLRDLDPATDPAAAARSGLLVSLHYRDRDTRAIFDEHLEWDRLQAQPRRGLLLPHPNDRDPNRRLRVGYVSPDFREHSVAYFAVTLLAGHDRSQFEIHVFDNNPSPDDFAASMRPLVDRWHEIHALADAQFVDLVRRERIDILVDLTGHFGRNRLLAFAQKPAPIQVTYLGYPNTTGLATMDYRFTDAVADPPGTGDELYSERLIRLPRTAWCYHPNPSAPPVGALPMLASGRPTFASFNNFAKASPQTLDLWAGVMRAVPSARLLVKAAGLGEPAQQARVLEEFSQRRIERDRIELLGRAPSTADHMATYARCDVALDTFPYHGTTTTAEALWMGVPVVTLLGQTHVARVSASLLTSAGLGDLVARDPQGYVAIAAGLVSDPQKLSEMRAGMRQRLAASALLKFRQFARDVEAEYRQMWKTWCAAPAPRLTSDDHNSLGIDAYSTGQFDDAERHFRAAREVDPENFQAVNNLANVQQMRGRMEEAIALFRRAVELRLDNAAVHSNLLMTLHYRVIDPRKLFDEHVEWARRHADPLSAKALPHENSRDPDRRLRLGYVSADFHEHSVMYFISSILRAHDHTQFEIVCFDNTERSDDVTAQLTGLADRWHRVVGMGDEEVAQLIRREHIDLLIDLGGHTADNRLLVFARRPAPVQITYQGYPNTTGIRAIDYRLTDAIADPPGQTDPLHTETLIRLPQGAWCYSPPPDAPDVRALPMLKTARPTFASFNNLAKVAPETIDLWAGVLRAVDGSRMLIKAAGLSNASARDELLRQFAARGIDPRRVEPVGRIADLSEHLQLYDRCDVALDTFPYHGTTTTCEAMWMGLPVVTLTGNEHVSRVSTSLLATVGLPELAANAADQFIEIARRLVTDPARLAELRATMRDRLIHSPLLNGAAFTRALEAEYRTMWRAWCADFM